VSASGLQVKEAADAFELEANTVRADLCSICRKVQVHGLDPAPARTFAGQLSAGEAPAG
jgi:DNA-binding NarL/FixJ family response regulator